MAFAGPPTDAARLCQEARQSLQQGNADAAISQLQQATQLDPQNFEAHQLLGVAYGQKGMVNEAMQALYTAVTLDPNSAPARLNYAAALQRAGYLQEAADQLQAALQINPSYEKAQQALREAQALMQQQAAAAAPPPERREAWEQPVANTVACPSCRAQNAADAQFCWQCGQPMKAGAPLPAAVGMPKKAPYGEIPFEARERYGFIAALWETWREACFSPNTFFPKVGQSEDTGAPILFAVILGSIGMIAGLGYQMGMQSLGMMLPGGGSARQQAGMMAFTMGTFAVIAVLSPLFVVIGLVINSAIFHLFLMIFGGARKGFAMTLRVLAYASAAQVFQVIPFCGGIIGGIWAIVLYVIGLARAHETDTWRVVLAIFGPLIFCCGVAVVLAMVFGVVGSMAR